MKTAYPLHEFVHVVRKHRDACATADSVRAQLKRAGSAYGVTPRKSPAGHWLFPGRAVYDALGIVPSAPHGVTLVRERIAAAGVDLFQSHRCAEALLAEEPVGDSPRERLDSVALDADALTALIEAFGRRNASALNDEEHTTAEDWKRFNDIRCRLIDLVDRATTPLGWR